MRTLLIVAVSSVIVACAGKTEDAPVGDDATTEVATDGAFDADADPGPPCPPTLPEDGGACSRTAATVGDDSGSPSFPLPVCAYGDDPHGTCWATAICATELAGESVHWIVEPPPDGCGALGATCPAAFGDREGTWCRPSDYPSACDYETGLCGCEPCETDGGLQAYWHCKSWADVPPGCPLERPRPGTACSEEGKFCQYSTCCAGPDTGPVVACVGGYWWVRGSTSCSCRYPSCPF